MGSSLKGRFVEIRPAINDTLTKRAVSSGFRSLFQHFTTFIEETECLLWMGPYSQITWREE